MQNPRIYFFGNGQAEGTSELKHLIGGKGASLADLTRAGLNVPPGFTISAECCDYYYKHNHQWPDGLEAEVRSNLAKLEQISGRTFGVGAQPLLVAVRSGAAQSMPGMMDTLLNVGLNSDCVRAMAERTGNARGAWEAYLHFLRMFVGTVAGVEQPSTNEEQLDANAYEALCDRTREQYRARTGHDFPTEPWALLHAAINAVFASWHSDRAIAYRKHHRIEGLVGTAVNVQMMCPAEVAGVMFTANPVNQAAEFIIESAFGLGEAVVLGKVTPDRLVLDKNNLVFKERVISRKETRVATLAEDGKGQTGGCGDASLNDEQVRTLAQLGQRVEAYFKTPCDIEWALSDGQFFLLQSRAIKFNRSATPMIDASVREQVRQEEIAALRAMAEPGGTVWSRFNLAEILPEPTPMTWAIVRQFMSGRGGFGQMYRDLGFDPDPALDEIGLFDLICGRPYCNLSREPRMQYRNLPFEHRFAWLKANPQKAIYPQATLNARRAGMMFFVTIPMLFFKMWRAQSKQRAVIRRFADEFEKQIVPPYLAEVERGWQEDWSKLPTNEVLTKLHGWIQRTLFDFARHSLKPTALAALVLGDLERAFAARLQPATGTPEERIALGLQRAQAALRELVMGVHPDEHSDLPAAIRAVRERRLSRDEFLRRFGHRGSQEMELAKPRWSEDHAALDRLLDAPTVPAPELNAEEREAVWQNSWRKLADDARLLPYQRPPLENELRLLQRYMGLREAAKHHLLRGYALIRRGLVELDRRYQLQDGIFYLTPDDVSELVKLPEGKAPQPFFDGIENARHQRAIALSLPVPTVLFSDDLEAVGRALTIGVGGVMQGIPLSAGVVEAPAWVLDDVAGAQMPHEPYILVCPTTDPAWVPLFVNARGLVMETGGVLSHGAIVAREFGLPAVAGIPDVLRRIKTGDRLRIDGATGIVSVPT
jgi:phosphohistidine swiveling domain-containing protein